uniref:Uncharacterized protein n=1 Tax=Cacopsylla melanoneura TaxID=428564 RepID=A0A8D8ZQS9_9HEMI
MLLVAQNVLCLGLLVSPFCLKVHYTILNSYAKKMGTIHTNSRGKPIFYTNIMKNEHVEVDCEANNSLNNTTLALNLPFDETRKINEKKYRQLCSEYDYCFFKQIVKYHQTLRNMTEEVRRLLRVLS